MTDPDERIINRAISLIDNDWQDEREAARAALHRLFRDRRQLEDQNVMLLKALNTILTLPSTRTGLGLEEAKDYARRALRLSVEEY